MQIKVIINDGIATEVLADGPVEVEIVSIDKDYEDYEELLKYDEELHRDENLKNVDFTVAHFGED